jgi:hypothetical protein
MNDLLVPLLVWSTKAAAVAVVAAGVALSLRRRSSATRHLVWRLALVAVWLLPLGFLTPPPLVAPVLPHRTAYLSSNSGPIPSFPQGPAQAPNSPSEVSFAPPVAPTGGHLPILALLYGTGFLAFAARWIAGFVAARRLAAGASPTETPAVRIATDARLRVPVTFGVRNPVILLPADAPEWPEARRSAAVRHEAAHVRRRDWIWQSLAAWTCAIHWFNPLMWGLEAALRATAEDAADDEALASGLTPKDYAHALLDVAAAACLPMPATVAMARRFGVAARLRHVLAEGRDRRRPSARLTCGLTALMIGLGTAMAGLALAQRATPTPRAPSVYARVASFGPGAPFYGPYRLRNGGTARLAYVQDESPEGRNLWRPDGKAGLPGDIARSLPLRGQGRMDGKRRLFLRVDVEGIPLRGLSYAVRVPHESDWTVWQSYGANDRTLDMATFMAPAGLTRTDMRVGIASGRPRVYAHGRPGEGGVLQPSVKPYDDRAMVMGGWERPTVTVTVQIPRELADKDVTLAAYTADGRALELREWSEDVPRTGPIRRGFSFGKASPQDIERVELLVRDYEWVTFRGIHLYPNRRK